jgi:16S rRNA (uracil1498-N3)-methyltransferase
MAERFFTSDSLAPGEYVVSGAEAHHISTVRRFGPGDRVVLFNGDGNEYAAEVVGVAKKAVTLNVLSVAAIDRELAFPLVVASALPKGDRADFLVEKLTELGATRFIPLVTARSVVVPKESAVEKFRRAVIEASKQCGRNRLMIVDAPQKWDAFATRGDLPQTRFVLHTAPGLPRLARCVGGATVAVGPEGGFSPDEVAAAFAAGWQAVSLGTRVLRVETAALTAAAILGAE